MPLVNLIKFLYLVAVSFHFDAMYFVFFGFIGSD